MANPPDTSIGKPVDRVEGRAKVTGRANYAADYPLNRLAYGSVITSPIAKARIAAIDTAQAAKATGVIFILTHLNAPTLANNTSPDFKPFIDDNIHFAGQPVAMVIAETIEQAEYAAGFVRVQYKEEDRQTDFLAALPTAIRPEHPLDYSRGDITALQNAPVRIQQEYHTPLQVHNPMEPHATTAYWEGDDHLYIFNKSQGVKTTRQLFARYFQLKEENVKVSSPYVGGAFGSSSRMWPQEMMAVMGAKKTGRPVCVALQRSQVFNMVGYRPYSIQRVAIGAQHDGTIIAISHEACGSTSRYEQFTERILDPTKSMYSCPNMTTTYKLVPLDMSTPCPTRGPGETSGSFALESAIDELSYALGIDPLELRRRNFATADAFTGKPWSSNHLLECYSIGAEKFGWSKRNPTPRSVRRGQKLVGWGMSVGIYKAERAPASASVTIYADGHATVRCSVADTGPGSITILSQIAADVLGVPMEQVRIEWADADLPPAPPQYGSHTTASTGSAVYDAAKGLREKLGAGKAGDYPATLQQRGLTELSFTAESKPDPAMENYSGKSFSVHFVEVEVNETTGETRVTRIVTCIDAGRVINHKTAHSQVLGGMTWGIGIALMEAGMVDHRWGRYVNNNLADYHVPVHADFPEADILFIDQPDPIIDPMGAKGLGEVSLIGLTAGIANAVYHATGKRIRDLPITPDKLL
ncbi:MAG TPA: xanthine dehydrogenase family protein molybdopterin-binding subunit [Puia sp.]|nr:xanthine dehydrogenase family protein molybdopterin-binding subunit [Puia sp.]